MKIRGLYSAGIALLLAGCAHQTATFVGHPPTALGPEAEKVWTATPPSSPMIRNKAVLRAVRGAARISVDGTNWKNAKVGAHLGANTFLQTADNTSVDLFLGENGPVLRALANSRIKFERLDLVKTDTERRIDTRIDLQAGTLLGSVKKMAAESKYLVRTPAGVIQVRGTEFSVSAEGVVEVISGMAVVTTDAGQFEVKTGNSYVPGKGLAALTPQRLSELAMPVVYLKPVGVGSLQ